jgi:hypothetical protein
VLRKSSRRRRRRRRRLIEDSCHLHTRTTKGVSGIDKGGKLGIRSSWAGAGRNRKSGDWRPSSAYTDHGPGVSVHTGRSSTKCAVQCGSVVFRSVQFTHSNIVKQ